jgi:hypothetical protein
VIEVFFLADLCGLFPFRYCLYYLVQFAQVLSYCPPVKLGDYN